MPLEVWAVVHKDRVAGTRRYGDERPDAYHVTEKDARRAMVRWRKRRPESRWRVARLAEAML